MEDLVKLGRAFVDDMQHQRGVEHVDDLYSETAESIEAVIPPGRDVRIAKGRDAIKAKRQFWASTHEIHSLNAHGPFVHPPNRFAVQFDADVTQISSGRNIKLSEIAVYTVEDGKIVREEFFMAPR